MTFLFWTRDCKNVNSPRSASGRLPMTSQWWATWEQWENHWSSRVNHKEQNQFLDETFHYKRNSHFTITFVFIWAAALQKNRSVIWKQQCAVQVQLILCCPPKFWPKAFNNVVLCQSIDLYSKPLLPAKTPKLEETLNRVQLWRAVIFLNWLGWKGNGGEKQQHCYSIWLIWTHLVYGQRSVRFIKPEGCWALGRVIKVHRY